MAFRLFRGRAAGHGLVWGREQDHHQVIAACLYRFDRQLPAWASWNQAARSAPDRSFNRPGRGITAAQLATECTKAISGSAWLWPGFPRLPRSFLEHILPKRETLYSAWRACCR